MIYHIYIIYCAQSKLESECPYYQPTQCDFTKYFYFQCHLFIIETLYITKSVIYGIVLVKNVKSVFTLKQIYFSFPAQTAVGRRRGLLWQASEQIKPRIHATIITKLEKENLMHQYMGNIGEISWKSGASVMVLFTEELPQTILAHWGFPNIIIAAVGREEWCWQAFHQNALGRQSWQS